MKPVNFWPLGLLNSHLLYQMQEVKTILGAYGEKPGLKVLKENLLLCQKLVDAAEPVAIVAQGREVHKMVDRLRFDGPIFHVPIQVGVEGRAIR